MATNRIGNLDTSLRAIDGNDPMLPPLKRPLKAKKRKQISNVNPDTNVSAIDGNDIMLPPLKASRKAKEITLRIPGQGDRDSEVIPISIPKLI